MQNRPSNYEVMKLQMAQEFLKYDQDKMIEKFRLAHDDENLYVRFAARDYAVDRATGRVFSALGDADYNVTMTIYDVLCYSKPHCAASGRLVNMRSISSIQGSTPAQEGDGLFGGFEKAFDGHCIALADACEALNGVAEGKGDVAYRIPLFDFLPVMVQFWESDDEFPASLQLFVDEHMLDFMHYETVWFAFSHLLRRLQTEMERIETERP
ncbi:MAG: DUF3786 domain-containing protein [Clostridia bacterium]|nr:DUF3786 domain-containing protein [Clostridia bacterium]